MMKKRLFLLISTIFALTACQLSFNQRSSSSNDSQSSSSDSSESTSSSSEESSSSASESSSVISSSEVSSSSCFSSSSSSSEPSSAIPISLPEPTIPLVKAGRTYDDYIKNSAYSLSFCPSVGTAKILVIPVWFEDSNSYITTKRKTNVRSDIEKAYFGTDEETGWRSVKSYYEEESHGALTLTGTVSDWYRVHQYSSYYAPEQTGTRRTMDLVKTATDWYFENNPEESRLDYDCDHNGYLDGVMLIYGCPDYSALRKYDGSYGNLWAYCYWVQNANLQSVENPGPNVFFWASYDFMYGANVYYDRTGVPKSYASGYTKSPVKIDTHTFIHEMGHVFGLSDYYDYSGQYTPAGGFSMQDHNVGGHDPFSSFSLGWGEAYIPQESMTISIRPFSTSGEFIILSPSWNEYDSAFDEYIAIEYFTLDGLNEMDTSRPYGGAYPTGSKKPGIRVWHVDARLLYANYNESFSYSRSTTDPLTPLGQVELMMSNSYGNKEGYISPLGSAYTDYNLLQLIRNNETETYYPKKDMTTDDLFYVNDTFSMETVSKQFKQSNKLNSGKSLGYSFTVSEINDVYASISITKL